ncbi:MAG TPA: uL15 family ribosomal protein, partial [Flavobacteriales bacterium]|nr:uL15 family ribosomal protein [Flavobacteriales bacterium]
VLGRGEVKGAIEVKAHAFSAAAKAAIEAKGGKTELVDTRG